MPECFAVVSGSYSDYQVHVVFEAEQDAKDYAAQMSRADLKRTHDSILSGKQRMLVSTFGPKPSPHEGDFDSCPVCVRLLDEQGHYVPHPYEVQRFDYWPAGTWRSVSNRDSGPDEAT